LSTTVQADRLASAQALAARFACTVVLKGSGSVIASPGRRTAINPTGGPALATAGSGDVLAGWLGGLWAQAAGTHAHAIACAGVYAHGRAGDGPGVLRAGDLIDRLAAQH
ncbi:bifunctional ADP-dependent NAD(P)H-hydrate dehydratase/NAD(P)H-hydrate epimerase, partial [Pelomonas sp. HMWF004]